MAGAPADSDATMPASEEELQLAFQPQVIGGPAREEPYDDEPMRGSPRGTGDFSERIQCELGRNEGSHFAFVLRDRSSIRLPWRRVYRADD
eukprot:7697992-Pyramimonas_sp.AAC.1